MTLTRNKLKWIRSLSLKKFRDTENCFIAEGPKVVEELISTFSLRCVLSTDSYISKAQLLGAEEIILVSQKELEQASLLKTPHDCLAVFEKREYLLTEKQGMTGKLSLALDGVQDPGNLGTIIRLADWFGITHIYCSLDCVDVFSPKVVQSTMGALSRVCCYYVPLSEFIAQVSVEIPIYGTFLDGENIYEKELAEGGLLVMGSEGKGISSEIEKSVTERILIPRFPQENMAGESLNVAVATAIACAEFRRQQRTEGCCDEFNLI